MSQPRQPITRLPQKHIRESKHEQYRAFKNADPLLHPFQHLREVQRAVTAAKLERMFAKPFVGSMAGGHVEGVYAMARDGEGLVGTATGAGGLPGELTRMASGSADGDLCIWNLATQRCTWRAQSGSFVRGVAFVPRGLAGDMLDELDYGHAALLSVGSDIRLWRTDTQTAVKTWSANSSGLTCVDHHRSRPIFATSSSRQVDIWAIDRPDAVQSFAWGSDSVTAVRFNAAQVDLLAGCSADRSVSLHDLRLKSSIAKVILQMQSNAVAWNPMEPMYFAAACEDHRAYAFDMRHLQRPVNVYTGHVGAVMDVDYSPTGRELVTAGYDKTIRIYSVSKGTSRDIYHTSRMQRVQSVRFTGDARWIVSGSDDGNVRLWRAVAHERAGPKSRQQMASLQYAESLKEQFQDVPEVNRLLHHRRLPKAIKAAARTEREIRAGAARKEERRRKHDPRKAAEPMPNIRSDAVVKTLH